MMNALTKDIESVIDEFSRCIIQSYPEISTNDLQELWNDISTNLKITECAQPDSSDLLVKISKCTYKFTKGKSKGACCGLKTKNGIYCSKHKKFEDFQTKEKTNLPCSKRKSLEVQSKSVRSKSSDVSSGSQIIRKNKAIIGGDVLWHPESGLVFKSATDPFVIGKCVNNVIVQLTDESRAECKRYGFRLTPNEIYLLNKLAAKFIIFRQRGGSYTVSKGKIGSDNIKNEQKDFESKEQAHTEMYKKVNSKVTIGYKIVDKLEDDKIEVTSFVDDEEK